MRGAVCRARRPLRVGALLLASLAGCQTPLVKAPVGDVAIQREKRREDVIRDFERRRDEAQYESALGHRATGDLDGCCEQLEGLLERRPDYLPAKLLLAQALADQGRYEQALEHVEAILAAHPDEAVAQELATSVVAALADAQSGRVEQASYEQPTEVIALVDGQATREIAAGKDLLQRNDCAGARAAFERALAAAPDDERVILAIATAALAAGQTTMAQELLDGARDRFATSARYYQTVGLVCYRRGDLPAAQLALQQALSLDNSSPLAYFLMGSTLAKLGDTAGADRHFHEAAQRDRTYLKPR